MVAVSDQQIVELLLRKLEPKLRRRILEVVAWLRSRHSVPELAALIQTGRALEVIDADTLKAGTAIAGEVNGLYLAAGRELAKLLSERLDTLVALDETNPRAVRVLQRNRLALVRELRADTRAAVSEAIRNGIERGLNPRAQARAFRDALGLTEYQQQLVQNYRRELEALDRRALGRQLTDGRYDRTVARAIREGRPLTPAQIDKMVARYQQNWIAFRAEVIARTEALRALHEGAEDGWRQAIEQGVVTAEELEGEWLHHRSKNQRDFHAVMHHQKRPFGQPFQSGSGILLMHPHDPNAPVSETAQCRCTKVTRLVRQAAQQAA